MKTVKLHIIFSRLLLFCFLAGQLMVYAHQHHNKLHTFEVHKKPFQSILKERCGLCDAMHRTVMLVNSPVILPVVFGSCYYYADAGEPDFRYIGLILASGRAPPQV